MNKCPNCSNELNIDEKATGVCFTCGAKFKSILDKNTTTSK